MKFFSVIATIILGLMSHQTLACGRPVNPAKVVLFVDTNGSDREAEAARTAACSRGETFVQIPASSPNGHLAAQEETRYSGLINSFNRDCQTQNAPASCGQRYNVVMASYQRMNTLKEQTPQVNAQVLDRQIAQISGANKAITSVVFSGHDGGGFVEGVTGSISKGQFFQSMNRHYASKPQLKSQLRSALLWGCYTATPEEVLEWKANFPDLKVLAGFNTIAPANTRPAGANMLRDILTREQSLFNQTDESGVRRAISGIADINLTHAGLFVDACNEDYYYSRDATGAHFETFRQMRSCNAPGLQQQLATFNAYFTGARAPDEAGLRALYDYARRYDHCFPRNHPLEGDHVALLLFFQAVKYNFPNVFAGTIRSAGNELRGLNTELARLERENQPGILSRLTGNTTGATNLQDIHRFQTDLARVNRQFFLPTAANMANKSRAEIIRNIATLEPLIRNDIVRNSPALRSKMTNLINLHSKMQNYLYQLNPACMDFLDWHFIHPGENPRPRC